MQEGPQGCGAVSEKDVGKRLIHCNTLQCTATHCNTLQHTATHVWCRVDTRRWKATYTLQHTATHCNILQHTATHCYTLQHTAKHYNTLPNNAMTIRLTSESLYKTLQHTARSDLYTATHCNALQHTATHCNILQHMCGAVSTQDVGKRSIHCNTLQHTATHCNTCVVPCRHNMFESNLYIATSHVTYERVMSHMKESRHI